MAEKNDDLHVYGTPAPEKQLPPATQGMRGENAPAAIDPPAEQRRAVDTPDGRKIIVAEESGTAFAESEGAGSNDGEDSDSASND